MIKPINTLLLAASVAAALQLAGCIDNNYDLSDIDTTVRVNVNSLTVPVNIDEIKLSSIIDIEEGDKIQIVGDHYALLETGTFNSSAINVNPFSIQAPSIRPSITEVSIPSIPNTGVTVTNDVVLEVVLSPMSDYHYSYNNISEDIVDIERLGLVWDFNYAISLTAAGAQLPAGIKLRDVVMQLPKGLQGNPSIGSYNSETGEIRISEISDISKGTSLHLSASSINLAKAGIQFDYPTHSIKIDGQTGLKAVTLVIPASTINSGVTIPSKLTLTSQPTLSEFTVATFTGKVKYAIENLDIAPVTLNDLPDFLNQEGTDIRVENPQIYISLTNPFSTYGIEGKAGLTLTAIRNDGSAPVVCSIDNGTFPLYANPRSNYCLSPTDPKSYYPGFENSHHVPYTSLSNILSGNGLPTQIDISITDPQIPQHRVSDFRLGSYAPIEGNYTLYAPLALGEGSQIVYTDTEDGWNDEDIDKVTVTELSVTASVSTNLPFNVTLTGYPVDINGNQINDVEIDGADIKANASGQEVKIHITGTVTHLDGIRFEARATAPKNSQALSPSQEISLKNIRATVSGYYEKEL